MKQFMLLACCLVGVGAYAGTTLRVPIFVENVPAAKTAKKQRSRTIPARWLNAKMKKAGLDPIPEYVEVSDQKDAAQFKKIDNQIQAAAKDLGPEYKDIAIGGETAPQQNQAGDMKTCFTGRGDGVSDVVLSLTDVWYSEQLGVWGWKYKKTSKLLDAAANDEDPDKYLSENSKLWKAWRGDDDSVLILTHEGDGGDDVADAIIPRCDD